MKHILCLPNAKVIKLLLMSTHLEQKKKETNISQMNWTKILNKYFKLTNKNMHD